MVIVVQQIEIKKAQNVLMSLFEKNKYKYGKMNIGVFCLTNNTQNMYYCFFSKTKITQNTIDFFSEKKNNQKH